MSTYTAMITVDHVSSSGILGRRDLPRFDVGADAPRLAREAIAAILLPWVSWQGTLTDGEGNAWSIDDRGECYHLGTGWERGEKS